MWETQLSPHLGVFDKMMVSSMARKLILKPSRKILASLLLLGHGIWAESLKSPRVPHLEGADVVGRLHGSWLGAQWVP